MATLNWRWQPVNTLVAGQNVMMLVRVGLDPGGSLRDFTGVYSFPAGGNKAELILNLAAMMRDASIWLPVDLELLKDGMQFEAAPPPAEPLFLDYGVMLGSKKG